MDSLTAITRGIQYLQHTQASDGHFDTFCSATVAPFAAQKPYQTTFLPSLILGALSTITEAAAVRAPLARWLLAQRSPAWSYNYWALQAPERAAMRYPDDLDDTFCALAGLYTHNPKLVDAAAMGTIVRLLLATESKVGGPYRTWLVPKDAPANWHDVDLAVNANVAYFLRLAAQPLPNLTAYMEQAIQSRSYTSPYYPWPYQIIYYIARAYRGSARANLAEQILALRTPAGHWGTPLRTALMLSALEELGSSAPQRRAIAYLLRSQQPDGSWPAEPFWLEVRQTYSGAAALTTAIALEALQKHRPTAVAEPQTTADRRGEKLYAQITAEAEARIAALPAELQRAAAPVLARMIRGDTNREVMLLPHFFAQSLRTPPRLQLATFRRLGLANLYGWTAYTLYDDILDGSDARLLPLASTTLRWSLEAFQRAVTHAAYQEFVQTTFTTIDNANAWEALHCRFGIQGGVATIGPLPQFGKLEKLAERSLGHALTPLGVLALQGIMPDDPRAVALLQALKHYLIARQLGDDMRDWQEDFHAGQCTYVVAKLLSACRIRQGEHPIDKLLPQLQHEAWEQTLGVIGKQVRQQLNQARRLLKQSQLVHAKSPVAQLLEDLEEATERTLAQHADAQAFLRTYNEPPPQQA